MLLNRTADFAHRLRCYSKHLVEKVATVTVGAALVSRPAQFLRLALDDPRVKQISPLNASIVAHVYYPELLPEILACWALMARSELHITTTEDRGAEILAAIGGRANITVHVGPNRGRDIAPFLALFASGTLDKYDVVLKLHTKSSPHLWDGGIRRKLLLHSLCGSRRSVSRTLSIFFNDPTTGMVGWGFCFRSTPRFWFSNEARVRALAARMNALDSLRVGFFEGSMFWFRPAALNRLLSLNLEENDFETESGQLDGTVHHAVERLFTVATWSNHFAVRDLSGRLLPRK